MDTMSSNGQMIDQLDLRNTPHSGFDRSNHNYGTGKLGAIIPVRLDEVYPGDRIKGRPETVVNFEPLAAPLMGSMVLKQESFFVPYIQLWKDAWKFFTGKNNFEHDMPSISPFEIWSIYTEYVHGPIWFNIGNGENVGFDGLVHSMSSFLDNLSDPFSAVAGVTLLVAYKRVLDDTYATLLNAYRDRKMFDLVLPAYNILKRYGDSEELKEISIIFEGENSTAGKDAALRQLCDSIADILRDFFNYFHGPSSLFDYLGWPVPTDLGYYNNGVLVYPTIWRYWIFTEVFVNYGVNQNVISWFTDTFTKVPLNFMPFKAYYSIWYWNYRDQLLETDILDPESDEFLDKTITPDVVLYCTIMRQRCWFKDTFTTALTNTGDGNLLVPTDTPRGDGTVHLAYYDNEHTLINTDDEATAIRSGATITSYSVDGIEYQIPMNYLKSTFGLSTLEDRDSTGYVSLDLFDRIKRLRSFVQKRLILGYEVEDVVYSSFMVKMSNVRNHHPELLGRGRDAVQINVLVNNTSTQQQIAGDKTATAYAHGKQSEMNYFSEDWGLTLSFMTILPIQSYAGGMQRLYFKLNRFDFMWPEFSTMGMDAVYNYELSAIGSHLTDVQGTQVFGYQGRYYDLKSRLDEEHGRLLTDLNYLTFSREWDKNDPPKLNYMFVHCWPRLDGFVLDSPDIDVFRYDNYNAQAWERRLPVPSEILG